MAETVKKPRAARSRSGAGTNGAGEAKSRKTVAPKTAAPIESSGPTHEQIAELARKYWAQRGYTDGHHEEDWFRAEQELRAKAS